MFTSHCQALERRVSEVTKRNRQRDGPHSLFAKRRRRSLIHQGRMTNSGLLPLLIPLTVPEVNAPASYL